jgi:hypothetical protein
MGNRNRDIATERIDLNYNYMKLSSMYREMLWKTSIQGTKVDKKIPRTLQTI